MEQQAALDLRKNKERVANPAARNYTTGIAMLILVILCAVFVVNRQTPPGALPAGATAAEFASGRAMERLKLIAEKPHPVGAAGHAEVRDYILKELSSLGLNPEVQKSLALNQQSPGFYVAASVQNIIGRIEGTDGRQTIMLACHYDSAPSSPGASDDGAGVAALLEVIRILKTAPPLKNDLVFLFTDGEEIGSLGAKVFMDEYPRVKDIAVALNFEARGVGGPSIMFETSEGNEWLINQFAAAAQRPVTNSFADSLYKLLPNSTDMTIFKKGGLQGLNFAYISGLSHYHTGGDSYENVDERSLQHHGTYALALARRLGNVGDRPARAGNAVYFDVFNSFLVSYSERLTLPLMALGVAGFIGLVILGLQMKRLTVRGVTFGFFGALLNVISVGALVMVAWLAIQSVSSNPIVSDDQSDLIAVGFLLLTVALTGALLVWFRKRTKVENLAAGVLLWWMVLMVLFCLYAPGGSYLFTWPLLLAVLALGVVFIFRQEMTSAKTIVILTLPALSGIILMAPLIRLMITGFGIQAIWIVMAFATPLIALHHAHLNLLMTAKKWLLPSGAALLGLGFLCAGMPPAEVSAKNPKFDHLFYLLNVDTGRAIWGSADDRPDEWTGQFFSSGVERANIAEHFPLGRGAFLKSEATVLPLPPPGVVVLDDRKQDGVRSLRLRVTSPRQAPNMTIYWKQKSQLATLSVNGKRFSEENSDAGGNPAGYGRLSYYALPKQGIELSLEIKSSDPVELKFEDWSYGLPEIPARSYNRRPDYIIASPAQYSDCVIVTKSITF